ncbi:sugar O-acetyltransferase [Helcococcus kunzii]|uniref:sugar O-acetyltransferase n=1 Tax=Helcococcus kunzii TaxID=40091 RepID=UPI0038A201F5
MNEHEKMLNGKWYDANFDENLLSIRYKAKSLCDELNYRIPHEDKEERNEVIQRILGYLPEGLELLSPFIVDYGKNIKLGKNVFINHYCYFMDGGGITIGDNVFFGPYVGLYTAHHPLQYQERNQGLEIARPIKIGKNCWFGANVSVMPGVTIGNGCVIAAGAVVKNDIPDNSLVAGVPAKIIRTINQSERLDLE